MKHKKSNVCHTCRAHKIGCDGKRPICSQCSHTNRKCGGYELGTVFVSYSARNPTRPSTKAPSTTHSAEVPSNTSLATRIPNAGIIKPGRLQFRKCPVFRPIDSATSDELTSVILNSFVPRDQQNQSSFESSATQVCGAWVGILPHLAARAISGDLVSLAIRAFGTVILDRSYKERNESFACLETYGTALQKLKRALLSSKDFFRLDVAAAIACLAMAELMLPTADEGVHAHYRGLSALLSLYPPQLFSSNNALHSILVGCRPVLLFQALIARRSTFLAEEKWLRTPFRHHPPSAMQMLTSDVAILPSIMEEVDTLGTFPHHIAVLRAQEVKAALLEVLSRLSKWKGRFGRDTVGNPTASQQTKASNRPPGEEYFWFPSLLAANAQTHTWAFQTICLLELDKLRSYLYEGDTSHVPESGKPNEKTNPEAFALAVKICKSMKYMLQDDTKLYGPASALFPLKTAYDALSTDPDGNKDQIMHCREAFDRIRSRGFWNKFLFPTDCGDRHRALSITG